MLNSIALEVLNSEKCYMSCQPHINRYRTTVYFQIDWQHSEVQNLLETPWTEDGSLSQDKPRFHDYESRPQHYASHRPAEK